MHPLLSPAALPALQAVSSVVLLDVRSGPDAPARFATSHLAGARHLDLDHDLAAHPANPAEGGRHPLPTPTAFAAALTRIGVTPESTVVLYDDKAGANAAARAWWMLRALGHERVAVLDGGWPAALAAGLPTATGDATSPVPAPPYLAPEQWLLPTADIDTVASFAADPAKLVIDVRESRRFLGETEPIDLVAGHIPGARNYPFADNLTPDGHFRSGAELRALYAARFGDRRPAHDVIVHCGSGVTACHTLLAVAAAGLPLPALYVGSWSEWSRQGRPIATGE